jgi:hypothetical protein
MAKALEEQWTLPVSHSLSFEVCSDLLAKPNVLVKAAANEGSQTTQGARSAWLVLSGY